MCFCFVFAPTFFTMLLLDSPLLGRCFFWELFFVLIDNDAPPILLAPEKHGIMRNGRRSSLLHDSGSKRSRAVHTVRYPWRSGQFPSGCQLQENQTNPQYHARLTVGCTVTVWIIDLQYDDWDNGKLGDWGICKKKGSGSWKVGSFETWSDHHDLVNARG